MGIVCSGSFVGDQLFRDVVQGSVVGQPQRGVRALRCGELFWKMTQLNLTNDIAIIAGWRSTTRPPASRITKFLKFSPLHLYMQNSDHQGEPLGTDVACHGVSNAYTNNDHAFVVVTNMLFRDCYRVSRPHLKGPKSTLWLYRYMSTPLMILRWWHRPSWTW